MYLKTLYLAGALLWHIQLWSQEIQPFSWTNISDHHHTEFGYLDWSLGEFMTTIQEASIILEQGFLHHELLDQSTSLELVKVNPGSLLAYPNPASNHLIIEHDLRGPTELRLWDPYGRLIHKTSLNQRKHLIAINHLPSQIYLLALYQNGRLQDQTTVSIIH